MDAWFFRQRLVAGTVVIVVQGLVVDWRHVADHAVSPVVGPVDQLRNAGSTAVEFYNARIRRYLTGRGRVVLWAGASARSTAFAITVETTSAELFWAEGVGQRKAST